MASCKVEPESEDMVVTARKSTSRAVGVSPRLGVADTADCRWCYVEASLSGPCIDASKEIYQQSDAYHCRLLRPGIRALGWSSDSAQESKSISVLGGETTVSVSRTASLSSGGITHAS